MNAVPLCPSLVLRDGERTSRCIPRAARLKRREQSQQGRVERNEGASQRGAGSFEPFGPQRGLWLQL